MTSSLSIKKDILPIFVVTRSNILTPESFRGAGFLIAPNILVTCWQCISAPLEVGQQYAVLVEEDNGYATHFLLSVEQHPRGLDLALAHVNLVPRTGLTLSEEKLSPGDEIATYEYHLDDKLLADGEDVRSQIDTRFLRGYVTRSFYYDYHGFARTPSYELDIPITHRLYGAPIIKFGTMEIAGVIYGSLKEPGEKQSYSAVHGVEKTQNGTMVTTSFGLAHDTGNLWSLRGTATGGKPLQEIKPHREYIHPHNRNYVKLNAETAASGKSITPPAGRVTRISTEFSNLYRQVKSIKVPFASADTKTRAEAAMERLRRKLQRYELQLTHEQLKKLREQRRIVRELKSMYPYRDSDFNTSV